MTDTQPLAPTDAEIDALWVGQQLTVPQLVQRRVIARAALAKWGTPQQEVQEPVAIIEHTLGGSIQYCPLGTAYKLPMGVPFNLYTEPQPSPASQGDSLDAARLDWLLLHISGAEFRRIGVHYSGNASRADVDAARKQGANHD